MLPYSPDDLCPVTLPTFCEGTHVFCHAANAVDDQFEELARLVGSGTTLGETDARQDVATLERPAPAPKPAAPPAPVEAVTPQIELVDHAPPLQFDLEMELQRAFNGAPAVEPAAASEPAPLPFATVAASAAATAIPVARTEAPTAESNPTFVSAVTVKREAPEAAAPAQSEADLSDLIAEELDRALQEEIAIDALSDSPAPVNLQPTAAVSDPVLDLDDGFAKISSAAKAVATAPMPMLKAQPPFEDTYSAPGIDTSDPVADFGANGADVDLAYPDEELRIPQVPFEPKQANRGGRKAALVLLGVAMLGATAALGVSMFSGGGSDAEVPVLMAAKEPAKVKPEDAGGSVVPNQDQAVYESVEGKAAEAPKQVELRDTTETPIAVQTTGVIEPSDDTPKAADRILTPKRVRTTVVRPDGSIVTDAPAADPLDTASIPITAPILTPAKPTGAYTAPTAEPAAPTATTAPRTPVTQPAPTPVKVSPVKVTAVPVTPQPVPAPQVEAPAPKPAPVAAAPKPKPQPKPQPKPVQTASTSPFAVQVSSQRSQAAARQSYANISKRYSSIIGGRGVDIRKAVVKGRDYYRVRIPAQSRSEANAICSSLKSAGGDCFVTR